MIKNLQAISLCSQCIKHEINSWMNEKWKEIDEEAKRQIREELKSIKLKEGSCIACNYDLISDRTSEKILKILEENKVSEKRKDEFKRFFC